MSKSRAYRAGGALALSVLAFAAFFVSTAFATYPGANGRIAFTYAPSNVKPPKIDTILPDGSGLRTVTDSGRDPSWSASGRRIVFARNVNDDLGSQTDIFTMSADGGDLERITRTPAYEITPSFAPGGKRIVFRRYAFNESEFTKNVIVSMRVDGSDVTRLTEDNVAAGDPQYSPDGQSIVYAGLHPRGIWVMQRDGSHKHRLAPLISFNPEWHPSGKRIAFNRCRDDVCRTDEALSVRVDGSHLHHLQCAGSDPVYAPSGSVIAFARGDIFTTSTPSPPCDYHQVTALPVDAAGIPSWQPLPDG
jgi:Tol biopolymer transport system component